jgi:hypothetical protein
MHRFAKPGNLHRLKKAASLVAWAVLGLTAGGCSTTHMMAAQEKPGDPLLGPTPPPNLPVSPLSPPAHSSLPPIPTNNGGATPATLASQNGWAIKLDGQASAPNSVKPAASPGSQPQVVPVPSITPAAGQPITPAGWSGPATTAETPQQLDAMLKQAGVTDYKQFVDPAGVGLVCGIPNAANPGEYKYYTVAAVDFPTAVHAVIRKIQDPTSK